MQLLENTGLSTPADYDWSLVDLDDQPVPFSRFKGKTLFLNFWATWCGPCVGEMPSIDELARDPRLQGNTSSFSAFRPTTSTESVRRFLKGQELGDDSLAHGPARYRRSSIPKGFPTTFLIAADGRIAAIEVGCGRLARAACVEFLEKLAARRPPAAAGEQDDGVRWRSSGR